MLLASRMVAHTLFDQTPALPVQQTIGRNNENKMENTITCKDKHYTLNKTQFHIAIDMMHFMTVPNVQREAAN